VEGEENCAMRKSIMCNIRQIILRRKTCRCNEFRVIEFRDFSTRSYPYISVFTVCTVPTCVTLKGSTMTTKFILVFGTDHETSSDNFP